MNIIAYPEFGATVHLSEDFTEARTDNVVIYSGPGLEKGYDASNYTLDQASRTVFTRAFAYYGMPTRFVFDEHAARMITIIPDPLRDNDDDGSAVGLVLYSYVDTPPYFWQPTSKRGVVWFKGGHTEYNKATFEELFRLLDE